MENKKILLGVDVSHHNYNQINPSQLDFVWLKATEGKTYKDPRMNMFLEHMANEGMNNQPFIGFYHYARPENNKDPKDESNNFIKTIEPHIGNCLLALDWEGNALKEDPVWALQWLEYVQAITSCKPLIYASGSATKNLKLIASAGFPLWVANYISKDKKEPTYYHWTDYKFWQFTSAPFDVDIFKGTRSDLAALVHGII